MATNSAGPPPSVTQTDAFDRWIRRLAAVLSKAPAGATSWGSITGTLASQTDLAAALALLLPKADVKVPFFLTDGSQSNIALTTSIELPFFLNDGSQHNIALTT